MIDQEVAMTIARLHAPGRLWRIKDRDRPTDAVDIGPGSPWATPFRVRRDGTRQDIVEQFDKWVLHAPDKRARWIREHVGELAGRDLVCACPAGRCHGGVLLTLAHLKTCRPGHVPAVDAPGLWLRVTVWDDHGHLHRFRLRVTGPGPAGTVLEASGPMRWMVGNSCAVIGDWIRARSGSAMRMADVHAQLAPVIKKKALAS
ncbi:hypothetical protein BQ8420_14620 [Nocardiopsis sp. JB363]|nr:hypothetical protein BQ8420_14620 [Nocardiopsis sp. JB363]